MQITCARSLNPFGIIKSTLHPCSKYSAQICCNASRMIRCQIKPYILGCSPNEPEYPFPSTPLARQHQNRAYKQHMRIDLRLHECTIFRSERKNTQNVCLRSFNILIEKSSYCASFFYTNIQNTEKHETPTNYTCIVCPLIN